MNRHDIKAEAKSKGMRKLRSIDSILDGYYKLIWIFYSLCTIPITLIVILSYK